MSDEWARRFKFFALAVDFIDDAIVDDLKELLQCYFMETLGVCYFRLLMEGTGTETPDGVLPTLETVWSSREDRRGDVALYARDGCSSGHLALAFESRRPLWITARDGSLLTTDNVELVDSWSRMKSLPDYVNYGDSSARTSIVVPLSYGERLFGVMDLEFEQYMTASTRGKEVIRLIEDAVSRIFWLNEMSRTQRDDTRAAFNVLERSYHHSTSPLQRHTVFLASSGRADAEVMSVILRVLGEFDDVFDVKYWKAEASAGNIAEQVRAAISDAEFGVCYISEPSPDATSKYRFLDNPNVLFEAGMIQMLHEMRDDHTDLVSRWIPVREGPGLTPPLPFNFAGDRVVLVPRADASGSVDVCGFEQTLRKTVKEVIRDLDLA